MMKDFVVVGDIVEGREGEVVEDVVMVQRVGVDLELIFEVNIGYICVWWLQWRSNLFFCIVVEGIGGEKRGVYGSDVLLCGFFYLLSDLRVIYFGLFYIFIGLKYLVI